MPGTRLDKSNSGFTDADLEQLCEALSAEDHGASFLSLGRNTLSEHGLHPLMRTLRTNATLQTLLLWGNGIGVGPEGGKLIADALCENKTLTYVDMEGDAIGPSGAMAFAEALRVNPSLKRLDLRRNALGDQGAEALGEALNSNTVLSYLNLAWNQIRSLSAAELAPSPKSGFLATNESLTHLDLFGNDLGAAGGRELGHALARGRGQLVVLDVGKNALGYQGCVDLLQGLGSQTMIRALFLFDNEIDDVPNATTDDCLLGSFPSSLERLDISSNRFQVVPKRFFELFPAILSADLHDNHWHDPPREVAEGGLAVLRRHFSAAAPWEHDEDDPQSGNHHNRPEPCISLQLQEVFDKAQSSTITEIALDGSDITDAGVTSIARFLGTPFGEQVKTLSIGRNKFNIRGLKALCAVLSRPTSNLVHLALWGNGLGPAGASELAEALRTNGSIETIDFEGNDLGPEGAVMFSGVLTSNITLKKLDWRRNAAGDRGAEAFSAALTSGAPGLASVNLEWNEIGPPGGRAIGLSLKANTTLTELQLFGNSIGPEGALTIGEAMKTNKTLKVLGLGNNNIGGEGAKLMLRGMSACSLTSLSLFNNNLDDEAGLSIDNDKCMLFYLPPQLEFLDVSKNQLRYLCQSVRNCTKLNRAMFAGNPWNIPLQADVSKGLDEIRSFLERMFREGAQRTTHANIFLLGAGGSGKTSFKEALMSSSNNAPFHKKEDRTDKVETTRWIASDDQDHPVRVTFVDVGGDTDPELAVQIFKPPAIFTLVFDLSTVSESTTPQQLERLLGTIQSLSPGADVVIVGTHVVAENGLTANDIHDRCALLAGTIYDTLGTMRHVQIRRRRLAENTDSADTATEGHSSVTDGAPDSATGVSGIPPLNVKTPKTRMLKERKSSFFKLGSARKKVHISAAFPNVHGFADTLAKTHRPNNEELSSHIFKVDCQTGEGIAEAREKILARISLLRNVGTDVPASFAVVRDFLDEERKGGKPHPRFLNLSNKEEEEAAEAEEEEEDNEFYQRFLHWFPNHVASRTKERNFVKEISFKGFVDAIRFWSELGEIYTYAELVFLDPALIFELVGVIVRTREGYGDLAFDETARDCIRLQESGLLSRTLLAEMLRGEEEKFPDELRVPLTRLLLKLGIMYSQERNVPLMDADGSDANVDDFDQIATMADNWLVPALMPRRSPPTIVLRNRDDFLYIRRFTLPYHSASFIHNIHRDIASDGMSEFVPGVSWGFLRKLQADSASTYGVMPAGLYTIAVRDEKNNPFPAAQSDSDRVGWRHLLLPANAKFVLTVEANHKEIFETILSCIRECIVESEGLRGVVDEWIPTFLAPPQRATPPGQDGPPNSANESTPVSCTGRGRLHARYEGAETVIRFDCFPDQFYTLSSLQNVPPPQVFLSYCWTHRNRVLALYDAISPVLRCWLDSEQMLPSDSITAAMEEGVTASLVIVVCMTPSYFSSKACIFELETALKNNKRILPLFLESSPLPPDRFLKMVDDGKTMKDWEGSQAEFERAKEHFELASKMPSNVRKLLSQLYNTAYHTLTEAMFLIKMKDADPDVEIDEPKPESNLEKSEFSLLPAHAQRLRELVRWSATKGMEKGKSDEIESGTHSAALAVQAEPTSSTALTRVVSGLQDTCSQLEKTLHMLMHEIVSLKRENDSVKPATPLPVKKASRSCLMS